MIGSTVSHYRVLRDLGAGGMGAVYEAEDLKLGRRVALKFVRSELLRDRRARERFEWEARAASAINHPHICTVHDIGEYEGQPFIVMELVEGTLLSRLSVGKPLPIEKVLDIGIQICEALGAAHARNIIHRDLKPGNVVISERGEVKLLDFGLAKSTAAGTTDSGAETLASFTTTGFMPGTPAYMAPEQILGQPLDARTDLFALGVLLYEIATGHAPFEGATPAAITDAVLHSSPAPPLALNPRLPPDFANILHRALECDPALRYQSAADLKADLQRLRKQLESGKHAQSATADRWAQPRAGRTRLARPVFISAGVMALLAVLVLRFLLPSRLQAASETSIAVLPFRNPSGDSGIDYLRLALADEAIGTLSHVPRLAVRPLALSMKFQSDPVDLGAAARELHASVLLTGHFLREGQRLGLTIELLQAKDQKLLWQDTLIGSYEDLAAMQKLASERLLNGITASLSLSRANAAAAPDNSQAYELYLRSISLSTDSTPNQEAIGLLRRSTSLDANYAPAWNALGRRYSYAAGIGLGACPCEPGFGDNSEAIARAQEAFRRALSLDRDYVDAAAALTLFSIEQGQVAEAYRESAAMAARRPDAAQTHLSLATALRYGGSLNDSARECDAARSLDQGSRDLRSCALTFELLGNFERATDYVQLDAGSDWATRTLADIRLRQGKFDAAATAATPGSSYQFLVACTQPHPGGEVRKLALELEDTPAHDLEGNYFVAGYEAWCRQPDSASRILRRAITGGYCAWPAVERDPLFETLRPRPEYASLRAQAQQCHENFVQAKNATAALPTN